MNNYELLSKREKELLKYRVMGLSKKDIAKEMKISFSTIHSYLCSIYEKLLIPNSTNQKLKPSMYAATIYWQNNLNELKEFEIKDQSN